MRKKGSIIIILEERGIAVKNFLYMLSEYEGIHNFELVFAFEKRDRKYIKVLVESCFFKADIVFVPIVNIENKSRVYNAASRWVNSDILIFMNTNIILENGCLEEMGRTLEEEDVLAVQPMMIKFHSSLVQSTGYIFSRQSVGHALLNRDIQEEIVNISSVRSALSSCIFAINRFVFEELEGFNEKIPLDWIGREITLRISSMGYKNYYNHLAHAYFVEGGKERKEYSNNVDIILENGEGEDERSEMGEIFQYQMKNVEKMKYYVVINFSGILNLYEILQKLNVEVIKIINYSQISETETIEFEKILPFHMMEEDCEYIYFSNNFYQIKDNPMWFKNRMGHKDLLVDLTGNVLRVQDIKCG